MTPQVTPQCSPHWLHMLFMNFWVRSAITGRSVKLDGRTANRIGMGTLVQVVAGYLAKVKAPLEG